MADNIALIAEINHMAPATVGETFISVDVNRWVVTVAHPTIEETVFTATDGNLSVALGSVVDQMKAAGLK